MLRPFKLEDFVDNPVALIRIGANLTRAELAARLGVSQPYISKIERLDKITAKLLDRVHAVLKQR